jgi:geranylgeranyl pyrophosphate synthase
MLHLVRLIRSTEGIEKTQLVLTKYIAKAGRVLSRLPESFGRDMLSEMLDMSFHGYKIKEQ